MGKIVLKSFILKMRGSGKNPLKVLPWNAFMGVLGGSVAIGLLSFLSDQTSVLWLMAPFGASCVLAFGVWDAPLSQPRNIVGGHFISTFIGLVMFHIFGDGTFVIALGVGLAIGLMMLTKTTHPPAGADPIVVIMAGSSWSFLIFPVLIGSLLIVLAAIIVNNMDRKRSYPTFWV